MDEVVKALVAMGPGGIVAGVMFFLWRDERTERRELTLKLLEVQAEAIEAENSMTKAIAALAAKLKVEGV